MASRIAVTKTWPIYIALGANLPSVAYGEPRATLEAVLNLLAAEGIAVLRRSSWWQSGPQPASDQPDFINGVIEIDTGLSPSALLACLHRIEAACGRVRQERWEARTLDIDLIDYQGQTQPGGGAEPVLPHPRLTERLFVLLPLQEIAPDWRHPSTGIGLASLIAAAKPFKINRL